MVDVSEAITEYLESKDVKGLAKRTQLNYQSALRHLSGFCHEHNCSLDSLASSRNQFIEFLEKQGVGGHSIQQYCTIVKLFARKAGYPINWDPVRVSNSERKTRKRKQLERWFEETEINECLAYEFPDNNSQALLYRITVRLLAETGARVRELAHTEAKHIDIDQCIIWLMDSKTEPRPAFFSPITRDLLIAYKKTKTFWEGKVLPSKPAIQLIVENMLRDLNIYKPGRGPHTFRHWTATKLFYDGNMRIEDLSMLMGTSVEIIVKRYLHPTPSMLKKRVFGAMSWDDPWEEI